MDRKLLDDIYLTLQGLYLPSHAVPGVPNLFQPFGYCDRKYTAVREAYERICLRLGLEEDDNDPDLDIIIESMEAIQEVLSKEMFLLGLEWARPREGQ